MDFLNEMSQKTVLNVIDNLSKNSNFAIVEKNINVLSILNMINETLVNDILDKIKQIELEYKQCQGLILSEDDLKCLLYSKISCMTKKNLQTIDINILGCPLHTEIPFYNEKKKLTIRPDITLFEPKNYSIKHSVEFNTLKDDKLIYGHLPSKQFEFGGNCIAIEIKFIKTQRGIQKSNIEKFKNDINKLKIIQRIMHKQNSNPKFFGILVIFNKTNRYNSFFLSFLKNYSSDKYIKVIYGSGDVEF